MKKAIMSVCVILSLNNAFAQGDNTAESAVDFSRISRTILEHKDLIQSSANQEVTVFLGYTGSGKSTLINYLAERDLEVLPDGDIQLVTKEDTTSMKIGETGESQTRYPQSVCVMVENQSHVLYDLPGFGDTSKDINTQLVNAAFIKHILVNAQKVRIVFVAKFFYEYPLIIGKPSSFISVVWGVYCNNKVNFVDQLENIKLSF